MNRRTRRAYRAMVRRASKKARRRRKVPRATISTEPQHHDLKTCPGGFVELRRMSYGELMTSQDMAMNISRAAVEEYQFRTCVVGHNLMDENDRVLDFKRKEDVHLLDGNVGQEISRLIGNIHDWQKNFPNSETPSANGSSADGNVTSESSVEVAKPGSATSPITS